MDVRAYRASMKVRARDCISVMENWLPRDTRDRDYNPRHRRKIASVIGRREIPLLLRQIIHKNKIFTKNVTSLI